MGWILEGFGGGFWKVWASILDGVGVEFERSRRLEKAKIFDSLGLDFGKFGGGFAHFYLLCFCA